MIVYFELLLKAYFPRWTDSEIAILKIAMIFELFLNLWNPYCRRRRKSVSRLPERKDKISKKENHFFGVSWHTQKAVRQPWDSRETNPFSIWAILGIIPSIWQKSHPCPERAETHINRKIINFYIEAAILFFSQLRQKIFFRARSKTFSKNFGHFWF